MITFKVDDVDLGTFNDEYIPKASRSNVAKLVGSAVEASSMPDDTYLFSTNNLVAAINTAYDQHLPLVLSPDMIWLAIAQGLSTHINNNAEALRHQFVNFEGKKNLVVYEDFFVKGSPNNDWPHMFGEFSNQIAEYIGPKRDLIVNGFSTTGPVELAASEVVLMESMSNYFDYTCCTTCGIPEITLLGTTEDWQSVLGRVRNISEFDLSWWVSVLEPIIQEFISASKGNANVSFWQNIYKENGASGGPYISGWITAFFPYLKDYKTDGFTNRNDFKWASPANKNNPFGGLTTSSLPIGMARVPFKWLYYTTEYKMELAAGFAGFQMENGVVKPQISWFVRDTEAMKNITATFDDRYLGWEKREELASTYRKQLEAIGFKETSFDHYDSEFRGALPKEQLDNAKKIDGLTITEE